MQSFGLPLSARLRRINRDETGVTLAELLVTMALLSMLMVMIMTIFITFTKTFTADRSTSNNTASAAVAMNELTRVIRAGTELKSSTVPATMVCENPDVLPVFTTATAEKVTFHAFLDTAAASPKPVKVEFLITPDRTLVEKRWVATAGANGIFTFGSVASSERTIVRQIAAGGAPVFAFLKKAPNPAAGAPTPPANAPTEVPWNGLAGDKVCEIIAVTVSMTVQTDPTGRAQTASLQNTVGIPNLDIPRIGFKQP